MTSPALPRPRQVTLAAAMIIGGSVLVVLTVFDRMAGLNDLDTRDAIEAFLSRPPGDGLGLEVHEVVAALRVFSMIAGACAAAAAILGVHVLRRHRGARIGLTVLAVPLFLSGLVAGGFLSSVVAASALMLWLEPSRDWFAGRPAKEPATTAPADRNDAFHPPAPTGPRPHEGFGTPTAAPGPPAYPSPQPPAPVGALAAWGPPLARPSAVVSAAVLTWVFSALAALVMAVSALVMFTSPDLVFDEMRRQNPDFTGQQLTDRSVQVATWVVAGIAVTWSVAASVFAAVLVNRRRDWARIALLVCAGLAGLVCLAGAALGSVLLLVPFVGCAATFSLLLRRDVRAWVAAP